MIPTEHHYTIEGRLVQLPLGEYIRGYYDPDKYLGYCRHCPAYLGNWSCPPFDYDVAERLARYTTAQILVHKVTPDVSQREACLDEETHDYCYSLMYSGRDCLDPLLYAVEARHEGSLLFTAGRCRLCLPAPCTRSEGKPCRRPEQRRSSLESWGFDLSGTTERLAGIPMHWGEPGRPPRYLTMVSAILSDGEIPTDELAPLVQLAHS